MAAFRPDVLKIRDYVTANDGKTYDLLPPDVVAVSVTHSNLPQKLLDLRFNLHSTIWEVKDRLRLHIGTPPEHQTLILKDGGQTICELGENSKMLGFYSVVSGMEIHIVDSDPYSLSRNGGLTDVSLVQKFSLSDEAYEKRKGTVREWIKKKKTENPFYKAPKLDNNPLAQSEGLGPKTCTDDCGAESIAGISVGARCEVNPGGRRGTVRFVGEIEQLSCGYWVGIQLDEPLGKNNGSVKGVKIFECEDGFGTFTRGKNVVIGDFPERSLLDTDDEGGGDDNENNREQEQDPDEI